MDNNINSNSPEQKNAVSSPIAVCKRSYNLSHLSFAIVSVLVGILYYNLVFLPFIYAEETYKIFIFSVIYNVYLWLYFHFQDKSINRQTMYFMCTTLLFSFHFVLIENSHELKLLSLLLIHLSALLSAFSLSGKNILDGIVTGIVKAVVSPLGEFLSLFGSFSALKVKKEGSFIKWSKKKSENLGMVIVGIVISLPLLIIVVCLLMSDSFFEGFASDISDMFSSIEIDINISPLAIIVSLFCALILFGALYAADSCRPQPASTAFTIPAVICSTVMTCFTIVYTLFMVAQIDGFVCMASGVLPYNTTYAEFARSGFFELCSVACINGLLLYVVSNFCSENSKNSFYRKMRYFVCFFTVAIIAVAASKMIFYINAYGFTQKRFCTLWFMALLLILFCLAVKFFKKNSFRFSRISTYITSLMLIILFYVDWNSLSQHLNKTFGY